jgi:hypothetical protein
MKWFKNVYNQAAIAVVLTIAMITSACNVSGPILALDGVVAASTAAVAIVSALEVTGKVDAVTGSLVTSYASAVSKAASESVSELQSTDTNAVKFSKISAFFAAVAVPSLGNTNVTAVVNALQSIITAVNSFLQQLHGTVPTGLTVSHNAKAFKLSKSDLKKLDQIKTKADKLVESVK